MLKWSGNCGHLEKGEYNPTDYAAGEIVVQRALLNTQPNPGAAIYDVATLRGTGMVTSVGLAGHIPGQFWLMELSGGPFEYIPANAAGPMLNPALQVYPLWMPPTAYTNTKLEVGMDITINGVPSTYLDIQPGDTATIVQEYISRKGLTIDIVR